MMSPLTPAVVADELPFMPLLTLRCLLLMRDYAPYVATCGARARAVDITLRRAGKSVAAQVVTERRMRRCAKIAARDEVAYLLRHEESAPLFSLHADAAMPYSATA